LQSLTVGDTRAPPQSVSLILGLPTVSQLCCARVKPAAYSPRAPVANGLAVNENARYDDDITGIGTA